MPHPEGRVDPLDDIELIETELLAADLEQAERRLERVVKQARSGDKEAVAEQALARAGRRGARRRARRSATCRSPRRRKDAPRRLSALTSKPVLYVANVDEGVDEVPAAVAEHAGGAGAVAVAISARVEVELGELGDETRRPRCARSWGSPSRGWRG